MVRIEVIQKRLHKLTDYLIDSEYINKQLT